MNYEEWSEEQLEEALDKLNAIHLKLRNLRSTIPRMVRPLTSEPAQSPELIHAKCKTSLVAGVEEVRAFKDAVLSDEYRKVIEHVTSSRRRNGKNIKPWTPRDDPSWASPS